MSFNDRIGSVWWKKTFASVGVSDSASRISYDLDNFVPMEGYQYLVKRIIWSIGEFWVLVTCCASHSLKISTARTLTFQKNWEVRDDELERQFDNPTSTTKSSIPRDGFPSYCHNPVGRWLCQRFDSPSPKGTTRSNFPMIRDWKELDIGRDWADWNCIGLHLSYPTWYRSDRPHWNG
jgi:hypothetical protein